MFSIEDSAALGWRDASGCRFPEAIRLNGGWCGERVVIALPEASWLAGFGIWSNGACPACKKRILCLGFYDDKRVLPARLAVYPGPHRLRPPIVGHELIPDRLRRTYQDALDVYNARVWRATVTTCGVTLEGLVRDLVPNSKGYLHEKLKALAEKTDFAAPLHKIAHLVKDSRNFGAHFDAVEDPSEQLAEATLRLTEYMLEYVYTLPRLIDDLESKLKAMESQPPADETTTTVGT